MHIGLLIYGSLETLSGGYLYDRMLVRYLRRQGDEVTLVSLPWRSYGQHLLDNANRRLLRRLQAARFDVLLQDELNHPSLAWLNSRLRRQVTYPLLAVVHHLRWLETRPGRLGTLQNRFYRQVERRYLASVDGFVYNSQATRAAVTGLVGGSRPGVVAYPAGNRFTHLPTPDEILARATRPGPLRLLFVGNLIPRKGLHQLLAALARLPRPTWQLTVVGRPDVDPAYARAVRQQMLRAGLDNQVFFTGPLPDPALAAQFGRAQLLVMPSSYEGFGIVYLEGMAFGLPALATPAGGARELVTAGENGYLVDPDDPAGLAAHLLHLHTHRHELARLSLAAQQRYLAHPTWDESMSRIRNFVLTFKRTNR
ncbi:MAG: glycosyltransferase family 4 protein [Ardenticatenaceae bacterium]|nr:glycosyltransferase family 4 protein [Ardenticatenaceae bacterium]